MFDEDGHPTALPAPSHTCPTAVAPVQKPHPFLSLSLRGGWRTQTVLRERPRQFASVKAAVAWAVSSGMSRTHDAAEVSLPTQLRPVTPPGDGYVQRPPSRIGVAERKSPARERRVCPKLTW